MESFRRACRVGDAPRIVLRHAPSGLLLTDGEAPVRFMDRAQAELFQHRFLDEADAWETITDPHAQRAA